MISTATTPKALYTTARMSSVLTSSATMTKALYTVTATPFQNSSTSAYTYLFGDGTPMLFGDGTEMTYA